MPPTRRPVQPRTFFLNEAHELSPVEKDGGGRVPQYAGISWAAKAKHISDSLGTVVKAVQSSSDPLKDDRYFVIAQPVAQVEKRSKDKKRAPRGTYKEPTEFGGIHGKVFDRLGLDLLQITDDGRAVVHALKDRLEQLQNRSADLADLGPREQSRWATIESFDTIPLQLRVDADWLKELKPAVPTDVVIELQPILTRVEADRVLGVIADLLAKRQGEKLTGTGTDFSGRFWFRGKATQPSVRTIAKDFYSVQAIHSPLFSIAAAKDRGRPVSAPIRVPEPGPPDDVASLPCVAVVDLGIPSDHKQLRHFRRGHFVPADAPTGPVGDHGSFVASRVVFGEHDSPGSLAASTGRCTVYDAVAPVMRLVVCADPPVNQAAVATWACRKVVPVLHPGPDVRGVPAPRGDHDSFPVIDRIYKLGRYKPGAEKAAEGDAWLIELSYDEIAPYPPGMDFDARQRVAIAAELIDLGESHADPQAALQALPIASTMNRLSIVPAAVRTPILIRSRIT